MIKSIYKKFEAAQMEFEAVSAISEENAATAEEVFASVENENEQIIAISKSVEEISGLSRNLKIIAENK